MAYSRFWGVGFLGGWVFGGLGFWGVGFLGGWFFLKTFPIIAIHSPRSSEFDASRRNICFEKRLLLLFFLLLFLRRSYYNHISIKDITRKLRNNKNSTQN